MHRKRRKIQDEDVRVANATCKKENRTTEYLGWEEVFPAFVELATVLAAQKRLNNNNDNDKLMQACKE